MIKKAVVLLALAILLSAGCNKSGELKNSSAERTIKKAFIHSGNFTVSVNRIQEVQMVSAAEADATLNGFEYSINGEAKPPYSGFSRAVFQHFNTGWALKQLKIGNGFGGSVMFNVDQPAE